MQKHAKAAWSRRGQRTLGRPNVLEESKNEMMLETMMKRSYTNSSLKDPQAELGLQGR